MPTPLITFGKTWSFYTFKVDPTFERHQPVSSWINQFEQLKENPALDSEIEVEPSPKDFARTLFIRTVFAVAAGVFAVGGLF